MTDRVALLLRRAGFGPTAAELAAARRAGYDATAAALTSPQGQDHAAVIATVPTLNQDPFADLVNPSPEQFNAALKQRQTETTQLMLWWLDRMTVAEHQALERLVFFWHGHWATSIRKVGSAQLMLLQHKTLRTSLDFAVTARRMIKDPALIFWLDGQLNAKGAPNENLARELMELFMLGIGHYTERDVKEAGRALTGWKIDVSNEMAVLDRKLHDSSRKTILGVRRSFDAVGLVNHLLGRPECPRFIAQRLWFRYASPTMPIPPDTQDRMVAVFPDSMAMLHRLLVDDAFTQTAGQMVKQPIEWLVGALRQLRLRPADFTPSVTKRVFACLEGMGQVPFAPPSVGGWSAGSAWLTSSAAQVRLGLAGVLADLAQRDRLSIEEAANLLAVDTWTNRTYAVLKGIDSPRRMLTVALASPEYLVS